MNLFKETYIFAKWAYSILHALLRKRPATTIAVIFCSIGSRIANLLAFFLPLKVILLAGSDGVPPYFRFFISQADKLEWVIWLAAGAVASYILALILDEISKRMADSGSREVMQGASKMFLFSDQRGVARSFYSRYGQMIAAFTFSALGLVAIGIVDQLLIAVLLCLFFMQMLFSSLILRIGSPAYPGRMRNFIMQDSRDYLRILGSINFLAGFGVILLPFLSGNNGNILLAILSVVLLRQASNALTGAINDAVKLYSDRHRFEPLIFRGHRLVETEAIANQTVRGIFYKTGRIRVAERVMGAMFGTTTKVDAVWQDSPVKEVYSIVLSCETGGGEDRQYFQQRIFPPGSVYMLQNEELLFSKVERERLNAPRVISRFSEGAFECQICEYGIGHPLSVQQFREVLAGLMVNTWCLIPPQGLVAAFNTVRTALPGRLTNEVVDRLVVAVDSKAEDAALELLRTRLPELQVRLGRLPLHVYNPDLDHFNVVEFGSSDMRVMSWCNWRIEPIGAGIPEALPRGILPHLVKEVNLRRKNLECEVTSQDIELADLCWNLEREINRGKYKGALKTAIRIIDCLSW